MKFAPEYVTHVLNENFEDAKKLLLSPLMAINYAHLVMLTEQGIISAQDALCNSEGCLTRTGGSAADLSTSDQIHLTSGGSAFLIDAIIDRLLGGPAAGKPR